MKARTASSLNHENICTIYEIDEHDWQPFIAMELLEGDPLSSRMSGRLFPVDTLLDIAIQVADARPSAASNSVPWQSVVSYFALKSRIGTFLIPSALVSGRQS